MTMEALAQHMRDTWSYAGLEVRGHTNTKVHAVVGPEFPISDMCADLAHSFDAIVTMRHDAAAGTVFVVECGSARPAPRQCGWWKAALLALMATAALLAAAFAGVLPSLE